MNEHKYVLALDQGTTSSRAIVFSAAGDMLSLSQQEFPQILPAPGIVEHDPEQIWASQLDVAKQALRTAGLSAQDVVALGITNQRETTILWERETGQAVAPAIVWQSRVSSPICQEWNEAGYASLVGERTGLVIDAYFSASKIAYLLRTISGLRERAERGEILFGTVDSYLIWRLTHGKRHVTDQSNASRTMLFDIHQARWDDELLRLFGIPRPLLPEVQASCSVFGETDASYFGSPIPITGVAGDQQAAAFGQACFQPGQAKNTYGTGCFLLLNTGNQPVMSANKLLTTIGWEWDGRRTYFLEGAVFVGGAVVQWLRDGLMLIKTSSEIEALASSVDDSGGVTFVPAFVGLAAPYWDPNARGTILGITRGTSGAHIARAALESIALQTRDLCEAMSTDTGAPLREMHVDGGAAGNDLLMQFQADILGVPIRRPRIQETTALGVAYMAGLTVGYWKSLQEVANNWTLDRSFEPNLSPQDRAGRYQVWKRAVERARNWA
jgi:glycerol kinase